MNVLATSIARTEDRLSHARERMRDLRRETAQLEQEALHEDELDERNREAYMGERPVLYVLTASSAAEAAARLGFLNEMSRRDEELAFEVAVTTDLIAGVRVQIAAVAGDRDQSAPTRRRSQGAAEEDGAVPATRRRAQHPRRADPAGDLPDAAVPLVSHGGPYAIADNFGAPRHEPEAASTSTKATTSWPQGTPILAPFDGVASVSHSSLGGLGVYVHGEFGYVYNAHLSRLGTLGPVEAGDVIGYVGSTGHSSGPHNHFEWHPENGDAVDPYEYLLQVCTVPPEASHGDLRPDFAVA